MLIFDVSYSIRLETGFVCRNKCSWTVHGDLVIMRAMVVKNFVPTSGL